MIVAIVRFILGFVAAVLIAGLVQVLFVAGVDGLAFADEARLESLGMLALLAATQAAVFAAPFAIVAAIVSSWLPVRSVLFFGGAGLAIALAGFAAQFIGEMGDGTILNRYALAAYAASGLAAGLVYWLVAVPKRRPASPPASPA